MDKDKTISNIKKCNLSAEDKKLLIKLVEQKRYKELTPYLMQLLKLAPELLKLFGIID